MGNTKTSQNHTVKQGWKCQPHEEESAVIGFQRQSLKLRQSSVTNMESRFPAMQVLWLGREFYKVKHGVTSASVMALLTLATILAIWRPWGQIDDSRKSNPFLDISTRKGNR
ncbi:hypothetical protein AVEN_273417-1 [Araneus ventricosus]|uniref:Uncharacterized protein n=1 Tax=Araneus ventricosus TaxID=182803 RepID=A0A4Y2E2G3_ARAVE|nr:hypothetical protein AVEN_273417-1 [Araneus ventricosus]